MQKVAVVRWCGVDIITGNLCPIPAHARIGAIMSETAVAEDWCRCAEAEGEAIAGDGRCSATLLARQSIREYELIWLLQQRLRAVS